MRESPPRFLIDGNVGRLARWLRALGYDSLLAKDLADAALLALARREGRWLLTRDSRIMERRLVRQGVVKALFIQSQAFRHQVAQVIRSLGLDHRRGRFTRCLECNALLEERDKETVRDRVPTYVYRTQDRFQQCPQCRRIYWRGTHWELLSQELEALLSVRGSPGVSPGE